MQVLALYAQLVCLASCLLIRAFVVFGLLSKLGGGDVGPPSQILLNHSEMLVFLSLRPTTKVMPMSETKAFTSSIHR